PPSPGSRPRSCRRPWPGWPPVRRTPPTGAPTVAISCPSSSPRKPSVMAFQFLREGRAFGKSAESPGVDGSHAAVGSHAVAGGFAVLPCHVGHSQALRPTPQPEGAADPPGYLVERGLAVLGEEEGGRG